MAPSMMIRSLDGVNTGDFGGDDGSVDCGEHGDCGESGCGGGKSGAGDGQADFFGDRQRGGVAALANSGTKSPNVGGEIVRDN